MKDTPLIKAGDWVKRGQLIGYVGSTGNSNGPHCHYDIREIRIDPLSWIEYVYGWSLAMVKSMYVDPSPYIKNHIPLDNTLPFSGYGYLEYVASGSYYHPGIDLNSANDFGKLIYSPVEGRARHVLGTTWIKNLLGKLLSKNYNSGWGNMVVIEEMPGFDISKVT